MSVEINWLEKFWKLPEKTWFLSACFIAIVALFGLFMNEKSGRNSDADRYQQKSDFKDSLHSRETMRLLQICDSQKTAIRIEEKADWKAQIQEQREVLKATLKDQQSIMSQIKHSRK